MATLPYAELISPWTAIVPQTDDLFVNDLDAFPPLHLSEHPPHQHGLHQVWQLVEGLVFSSTAITDDDGDIDEQWEDITYSTKVPQRNRSFAEIAEHSGTDHHAPIPNDRFLQWPKAYGASKRQQRRQSIHDENSDMASDDLFYLSKSRSRLARHRDPFAYLRRERMYKTKTRGHLLCNMSTTITNYGLEQVRDDHAMRNLQNKTRSVRAKLDWLDNRAELLKRQNGRSRPSLSKKTASFVRILMHELVERDTIVVLHNGDDDDDGNNQPCHVKGYWDKKRRRDNEKKQKFLQRQSPFSQFNAVARYLLQQQCCGPMDKWRTFYDLLRTMYEDDLLTLATEKAILIRQIKRDFNREESVRFILKRTSFFHFISRRDQHPAELRYKTEQIQDLIVEHWRDPLL